MNIKTRLRLINVNYKFSQWHKEAQKIALAVVITQFILAGGYCYLELSGKMAHFEPKTSIITVVRGREIAPETAKTSQNTAKNEVLEDLKEHVWKMESSRGKNNYSKCAEAGKVNGIGYGIPGNGSYICFGDHAEEMEVLEAWIIDKRAQGMTDSELLCLYNTGTASNSCKYVANMQ